MIREKDLSFKYWGFWATVLWGVVVAMFFLMAQFFAFYIYLAVKENVEGINGIDSSLAALEFDGFVLSISTLLSTVICIGVIIGIIKLKRGSNLIDYLGLKLFSFRDTYKWFAMMLGLILITDVIRISIGRPLVPEFMTSIYSSMDNHLILWFALIVAAPVSEEFFFRGFLMKGLSLSKIGNYGAIIITSALWAVIHSQYDLYDVSIIFIFGLFLGVARVRTGSLLVCIGMHAMSNLIATIQTAVILS